MPEYSVHRRDVSARSARRISEASFEAAAVAYAEDLPHGADEQEVAVVVTEIETGREHCYRIGLDSGDARPCA